MDRQYDVAIAMVVFNRMESTKQVFEEVRKLKPKTLFLISDAARKDRAGETEKVLEIRDYVETHIDWVCSLHKIYAEENMGCEMRVTTGLNQVFQMVDQAIILEDDCVPHPDFFRFCKEMLERYEHDNRVMLVSGSKLAQDYPVAEDYIFTNLTGIWGWATWRRAWNYYDYDMKCWLEFQRSRKLYQLFPAGVAQILEGEMERVYEGRTNSWAYRWLLTRLNQGGLGIVPKYNLIQNIGFGNQDATHTKGENVVTFQVQSLPACMHENSHVEADREYEKAVEKIYYQVPILIKIVYALLPYPVVRKLRQWMDHSRF